MPFGLKNVEVTYQRLIDQGFKGQIGRNVEVYVDDIVIKSKTSSDFLKDLKETLTTLRWLGLKLNPTKYSFGV